MRCFLDWGFGWGCCLHPCGQPSTTLTMGCNCCPVWAGHACGPLTIHTHILTHHTLPVTLREVLPQQRQTSCSLPDSLAHCTIFLTLTLWATHFPPSHAIQLSVCKMTNQMALASCFQANSFRISWTKICTSPQVVMNYLSATLCLIVFAQENERRLEQRCTTMVFRG